MAALDLKIKPTASVRDYRVNRGGGEGGEVSSFNPSGVNYNSQSKMESPMKWKINCRKPPLYFCDYHGSGILKVTRKD